MPSADWKVEIVDASGEADYSVTVIGDQVVDLTGATDGQVLTVQNDGTVAPEAPASQVAQTITNGETATAPSQDAVFDALALKMPKASAATSFALHRRTAGDIAFTGGGGTAWADVDNALDCVIAAAAGDLLIPGISLGASNEATDCFMDVVTVAGGNHFGVGGASGQGIRGWHLIGSINTKASGEGTPYVVQAGDISGGLVTCRLRARNLAAGTKTMRANANGELVFWVRNHG